MPSWGRSVVVVVRRSLVVEVSLLSAGFGSGSARSTEPRPHARKPAANQNWHDPPAMQAQHYVMLT